MSMNSFDVELQEVEFQRQVTPQVSAREVVSPSRRAFCWGVGTGTLGFCAFAVVAIISSMRGKASSAMESYGMVQGYAQSAGTQAAGTNDGLVGPDMSVIPSADALSALALPTTSAFMAGYGSKFKPTRFVDAEMKNSRLKYVTKKDNKGAYRPNPSQFAPPSFPLRGKDVTGAHNPKRRNEPRMSSVYDWSSTFPLGNAQESSTQPTSVDDLALALDEGTRKSHSKMEESMPQFINGVLSYYQWCAFFSISSRDVFSQLVKSLYFIYSAMETSFDATDDPNVKALDTPQLRRVAPLKEDMAYFFGPEWASDLKMTPATLKYVNRVMLVAEEKPYLLVGHQYIRYPGDVTGGQIMSSMARRSLKLDRGLGTRFYEFNEISSRTDFIKEWYEKVNKLELSQKQKEEIVAEANLAFDLNMEIFKEMQANNQEASVRAMWRLLKSVLRSPVKSTISL
jgi:heme oxygenase